MNRKLLLLFGFCFLAGSTPVVAQDNKFEINAMIGYTLSEGVNVNPIEGDMFGITRFSPTSAFSYDLGVDYYIGRNFSVGFNFGHEMSKLRADSQTVEGVDIADMSVNNYHGIFTYNLGGEAAAMRPYVFVGLGATSYGPDSIQGYAIEGETQFSTTWGGGIKFYTSEHLGFKAGVRWTPTHINSEPSGIWCSPYWGSGCYVMEEANYSHQFEISAGIVARF